MPAEDADRWLRRFHPGPPHGARLVCLPHAGGSAGFYFPLSAALAADCEVVAVQYPGRQDRRAEPCVTDLGELADRIAAVLGTLDGRPLVLFGHSMGALLGYEAARRLTAAGGPAPAALLASGRRAPATHRDERVHLMDDDGLLRELRLLDGTAHQVLADEELLRMVLPAIRADYTAAETYRHRPGPELDCAVTVLVGRDDPRVTRAEAEAWRGHTSGPFELHTFPGGHFYLTAHQRAVTDLVRAAVRSVPSPGR
ncbi:thioesterase II family protein [Marinactinospora rubrisoli]|uniref:Thioesterase II family protein n=1 Tax=Marinactinospora rubrisoli TaxID=2715399 RepID=A0ABW2KQM5_9ACTN